VLAEQSLDTSLSRPLANKRRCATASTCSPCALVKEVADALSVKLGAPDLLLVHTGILADGRELECTR
jgi:hypothetical protein